MHRDMFISCAKHELS